MALNTKDGLAASTGGPVFMAFTTRSHGTGMGCQAAARISRWSSVGYQQFRIGRMGFKFTLPIGVAELA